MRNNDDRRRKLAPSKGCNSDLAHVTRKGEAKLEGISYAMLDQARLEIQRMSNWNRKFLDGSATSCNMGARMFLADMVCRRNDPEGLERCQERTVDKRFRR
ncbi:hypothetical protein BWQ96_02538 [Gracilariopsis chorda]|uniref:Uncharacterized protein n=1 Tax=Gracilariopsis chorda TaxID=448386 RepID=A0A2V3IZT4_9FLOR|nr:hypothetical protein BWQ96_02538 [Gracilariopsis chorda]|eukprot:PXF47676.1 hypothetical protein BWQ96_02538 [Gracilariopsis chorda]